MTNWGYDDGANTGQGEDNNMDGPKALRDAYKALKAQNDELNTKLTSFLEREEKAKLASVFESLGVPGAAQIYQGDADPEKAKQWVESMRGVFGSGNAGGNPEPVAQPAMTQEQQQQYQTFNESGQSGVVQGNLDAANAAVGSATDLNALIAAMKGVH